MGGSVELRDRAVHTDSHMHTDLLCEYKTLVFSTSRQSGLELTGRAADYSAVLSSALLKGLEMKGIVATCIL